MGSHNRDWYRDWWARRTGYVERSAFRLGEGEKVSRLRRGHWRRNVVIAAFVVVAICALAVFR